MDNLSRLPPDMMMKIALELDLPVLVSWCSLSSRFNEVTCSNYIFWANRFKQDYPEYFNNYDRPDYMTWKDYYTQFSKLTQEELSMMGTGLHTPVGITEELSNFLANANFGFIEPGNPESGRVNDILSSATDGIATRTLMTYAMLIYFHNNNLGENKQVTDEMRRLLPITLASFPAKPRFDPNNLRYVDMISIISFNIHRKEEYNYIDQELFDAKIVQLTLEEHRLSEINKLVKAFFLKRNT